MRWSELVVDIREETAASVFQNPDVTASAAQLIYLQPFTTFTTHAGFIKPSDDHKTFRQH